MGSASMRLEGASQRIFAASQISPAPSRALMDVHRSETDGGGIRTGIFRNQRSEMIISDISMQPLVQASTRASKSI